MKVIHIFLILIYLIILILALKEITFDNICDNQNCSVFIRAFEKPDTKEGIIYLLDNLCEETVWPFAYISATILSPLFSYILPIELNVMYFSTTFLIIFITFYCILSFMIYHYIIPLKKYIMNSL